MRSVFQTGARFQDCVYAYSTCLLLHKQCFFYLCMTKFFINGIGQRNPSLYNLGFPFSSSPHFLPAIIPSFLPNDHPHLPSFLSTRFHMSSPLYSPFCWWSTGLLAKRSSILEEWEMPSTCIYECFHTTRSYFRLHRENINDICIRSQFTHYVPGHFVPSTELGSKCKQQILFPCRLA